jgi:hypothetical protein
MAESLHLFLVDGILAVSLSRLSSGSSLRSRIRVLENCGWVRGERCRNLAVLQCEKWSTVAPLICRRLIAVNTTGPSKFGRCNRRRYLVSNAEIQVRLKKIYGTTY